MSLPASLGTGTVTGHWVTSDGDPARGWVTFTPRASALISPTDETIVLPTPRVAQLVDGHLHDMDSPGIALPATDDPDITPIGWTWKVETSIGGADNRTFDILLPAGTTVDLSSVIEVTADGGTVQVISGSSVTVSDEAPENPSEGDQWWDSTDGSLNIYVSGAWVEVNPVAPVVSVNGKTSAVVLDAADVGAATAADITAAVAPKANTADLAPIATSGSASDLTAGTAPTARLGSGTASASTYLRGDQTWAAVDVPTAVAVPASAFASIGTKAPVASGSTAGLGGLVFPVIKFTDVAESAATVAYAWSPVIPWSSVDIYLDWGNRNASAGDVRWKVWFGVPSAVGAIYNNGSPLIVTATGAAASGSGTTWGFRQARVTMGSGVAATPGEPHHIAITRLGDHATDTLAGEADFRALIIKKAGT